MSLRFLPTWIAVAIALLVPGPAASADEDLWALLKDGGVVVLMRHAVTPPGVGDPPGMKVDDCSTQRNLTDEGRRHSKLIGEAWRAHGVQPDRVISSPMCRCLETARLAFGRVDTSQPVTNALLEPDMARQVREMRAVASEKRHSGVVVLVSHGTTIAAVTGITPAPGEMLIVSPQGDGKFELRGRLAVPAGS
ncbi:MAG: histidine phosphatase family protein [Usitatibacter sp.]